jgi:hypothetical protein
MSKELAVIHYKTAMAVFKKLFDCRAVSGEELAVIETIIAGKYGLSSCSIFR